MWWSLAAALLVAALVATVMTLPPPMLRLMPDMAVYRDGVRTWLDGGDPYAQLYGWDLPFIYPPISLLVLSPLALGMPPQLWVALADTALLAVGIWAVLRSNGPVTAPRAALGAGAILVAQFLEPLRSTVFFGQTAILLMTLVLVDLLLIPGRAQGVLTGLTAMLKLTPLIFVLYFVWARRFKALITFGVTCAVLLAVSVIAMPGLSARFYGHVMLSDDLPGQSGGGFPAIHGWTLIELGPGRRSTLIWVAASLVVFGLLLLALRGLEPERDAALAVCYIAVAGLLVSPLSWTHYWVWVVPLGVVLALNVRRFPLIAALMPPLYVLMIDSHRVSTALGLSTNWLELVRWRSKVYVAFGVLILLLAAWHGLRAKPLRRTPTDTDEPEVATPLPA